MRHHVNARVKLREEFRPFAPAVGGWRAGEMLKMEEPFPYMTLSGFLVRCWEARCWALLEPATGVALYDDLLRDWPRAVRRRDGGLYKARLAIACAASGQLDRARAEGRKALATARATQSATAARELHQLHDLLRN
jgi:hypothetical protein